MSKLNTGTLLCAAGVGIVTVVTALIELTTPPLWMVRILDGSGILGIFLILAGFIYNVERQDT